MSQEPTKAKLIEAAGEEFAEKGFEGATVRSICRKAGANVASVNYHFGDKTKLYEQTLLEAHRCGRLEPTVDGFEGDLDDRFRAYVRSFLESVFDVRDAGWHRALMLRELIRPTSAADFLVNEAIRPRFERLQALIREYCPDVDETRLNALSFSVVGQVLHYKVARSFSERLVGVEAFTELDIDYLTDHISNVCIAAFSKCAREAGGFGAAMKAEAAR